MAAPGVVTDEVLPILIDVAEKEQMKVAIHLEPYEGRNPSTVREDISHLLGLYGR